MSREGVRGAVTPHTGRCHCGAIRFEFSSDHRGAVRCNCSYCVRKAALHHRVMADAFVLSAGTDALAEYRFGTGLARHHFCRVCGIHTHCHPRSAPEQVNVNLHCVDAPDALLSALELSDFDGRHWPA